MDRLEIIEGTPGIGTKWLKWFQYLRRPDCIVTMICWEILMLQKHILFMGNDVYLQKAMNPELLEEDDLLLISINLDLD